MKISLNWINDFVDIKGIEPAEIVKKFTLATAEVEDFYDVGKDISGIIVAKVLSCEAASAWRYWSREAGFHIQARASGRRSRSAAPAPRLPW